MCVCLCQLQLNSPEICKLTRKESYKAQRKNYRKEKKRVTNELLNSLKDPSVVVLADWLKIRGTLKSWTKLWCVLKPGLLVLYKSPKTKVISPPGVRIRTETFFVHLEQPLGRNDLIKFLQGDRKAEQKGRFLLQIVQSAGSVNLGAQRAGERDDWYD